MSDAVIKSLSNVIIKRKCALFAGAGLTRESGGSTWRGLIDYLKMQFKYSSPLKDEFQIISDMCRIYSKDAVYKSIKERLKDATIDKRYVNLTHPLMPWYTVFTTNYDLALENALEENQMLKVIPVMTGKEFNLQGIESELLCVKLMGSLHIPNGQPGSMVLTQGDLILAAEERSKIFDILQTHAANLSFLFVGYSFNDGVFLNILEKLDSILGQNSRNKEIIYYAVFPNEPSEDKLYLLKQFGVQVIVSDLADFIEKLSHEISLRDPKDHTLKRIPIGSEVLPIDPTRVRVFLYLHYPVFFEKMEEDVSADSFLHGKVSSFKPFENNWHFPREEIQKILDNILIHNFEENVPCIVGVEGNPGTGRTFTILGAIYKLIRNYRSIAIEIPRYAMNRIPTPEIMENFITEIRRASDQFGIKMPDRIIFWAEFPLDELDFFNFKNLSLNCDLPICLIFEDIVHSFDEFDFEGISSIRVDEGLSEIQKSNFAEYIFTTIRNHRFYALEIDEINRIIIEEKKFLPIIYRCLDPSRRSIQQIVQEELGRISDSKANDIILICAMSAAMNLDIPLSLIKKTLSKVAGMTISYSEVFEIIRNGKSFLTDTYDSKGNISLSLYNIDISQYIISLKGQNFMDSYLKLIAQVADLRTWIEANFIKQIIIDKGVNWKAGEFLPFTRDGLENALLVLKDRQPARPILHHLARFYSKKDERDKRIIPLLKEALSEPRESYMLSERKENILTSLANAKWDQNKASLIYGSIDDPELQEIFNLLIEARRNLPANSHPYHVHSRILWEMSQYRDEDEALKLQNEAVEILNEGISYCGERVDRDLNKLLIEILSKVSPDQAINEAQKLFEEKNDGLGFYTLARLEYHKNSNPEKASAFLDKALDAKMCPPGAIALKIKIILSSKIPDYSDLMRLADRLSLDITFKDTWESAYHKAVIYIINGRYEEAINYFWIARKKLPWMLQSDLQLFWYENGRRKTFRGRISSFTDREGRIYSVDLQDFKENIYFNPSRQKKKEYLKSGLYVEFQVGFSTRGPIAFDVKPI